MDATSLSATAATRKRLVHGPVLLSKYPPFVPLVVIPDCVSKLFASAGSIGCTSRSAMPSTMGSNQRSWPQSVFSYIMPIGRVLAPCRAAAWARRHRVRHAAKPTPACQHDVPHLQTIPDEGGDVLGTSRLRDDAGTRLGHHTTTENRGRPAPSRGPSNFPLVQIPGCLSKLFISAGPFTWLRRGSVPINMGSNK